MFETIISAQCGKFTVDTAAVKVSYSAMAAPMIMKNPAGNYKFAPQDNINILSLSICLPYCFSLADDRLSARLFCFDDASALNNPVTQISSNGQFWAHSENVEVETDIFYPWQTIQIGATYRNFSTNTLAHRNLADTATQFGTISMVNAPAALHAVELPILLYMKVRHTLTITS